MKIEEIYHRPLMQLMADAHAVHVHHHPIGQMQVCALISYKTGGCPEDCKYCPQSARYQTEVAPLPLLQKEELMAQAKRAIAGGATRVCIGAAWRQVREGKAFDTILSCVKEINSLGVEVCCTLGMLTECQAQRLKDAGLFAYNHNLDSSREFYETIITTRTYEERIETLKQVKKVGLSLCCGGILGMGESDKDRIELISTLATLQPDSIPINLLIPIPGTPLETQPPVSIWEVIRMIATLRIVLPKSKIRLSAGRLGRSAEEQALCFLVGANSIFAGEKLLTAPNPSSEEDERLFSTLGLKSDACSSHK